MISGKKKYENESSFAFHHNMNYDYKIRHPVSNSIVSVSLQYVDRLYEDSALLLIPYE
jgi:hypothetical protein